MNHEKRISKLEEQSGAKCRVVVPVLLDGAGQEFERPPANDDVAEVSFRCNSQSLKVKRADNEGSDAFMARANREAAEVLKATIVLPWYIRWI